VAAEIPRMHGPDPLDPHPMKGFPQVGFLRPLVKRANVEIGDYTYYDDPTGPEKFEQENILYHYPFLGDKLVIGRFCAIARGAKFIMNGANHRMDGISTFPFYIFGGGWESIAPKIEQLPLRGDTVVGHDVWVGYEALIMPGVKIGDGAIIAARAVVTKDVPPYAVVGGNPSRVLRMRFEETAITRLLRIAWWNWDIAKITRNLHDIAGADVDALEAAT
jgi:virginiamycin A acetyltransferase